MRGLQRIGSLNQNGERFHAIACAAFLEQHGERAAGNEPHDDPGVLRIAADVVDGHDVRMIELGNDAGFFEEIGAAPAGIHDGKDLDRYVPVKQLVPGPADGSEPTCTEQPAEPVAVREDHLGLAGIAGDGRRIPCRRHDILIVHAVDPS